MVCDINHVYLVKQVLQHFAFQLLYNMTIAIKWMGTALVTKHIVNADYGNVVLVTERTPDSGNKMECFSYKDKRVKA